jgi:hypothetical protein
MHRNDPALNVAELLQLRDQLFLGYKRIFHASSVPLIVAYPAVAFK